MITLSYSRLSTAKQCPQKFWLSYLDPNRPKSEATQNQFGADGAAKHTEIEAFLKGHSTEVPLWVPDGFRNGIHRLREGHYESETEAAFTAAWVPTTWWSRDAGWRIKIDAYKVRDGSGTANVVDFKTGKVQPAGWLDQLELYALTVMRLYECVDVVEAELWYLFHDHKSRATIRRQSVPRLEAKYNDKRIDLEERATHGSEAFPKQPGPLCAYCAFHQSKGGPCSG